MRAFRASGATCVLPSAESVQHTESSCVTADSALAATVPEPVTEGHQETVPNVGEALAGLLHYAAAYEKSSGRRLLRRVPRKLLSSPVSLVSGNLECDTDLLQEASAPGP